MFTGFIPISIFYQSNYLYYIFSLSSPQLYCSLSAGGLHQFYVAWQDLCKVSSIHFAHYLPIIYKIILKNLFLFHLITLCIASGECTFCINILILSELINLHITACVLVSKAFNEKSAQISRKCNISLSCSLLLG